MSAQGTVRTKAWLLVIGVFVGIWLVRSGSEPATPPAPSAAEAFAAGPGPPTKAPSGPLPPSSSPVRLRIPGIQVDAAMTGLGLAPDGSLEAPPAGRGDLAGWYRDGVTPGAAGTAVVAGHVDDARGPAVFYALGTVRKGHRVEVTRRDGRTAEFTVDAVETYANAHFPDRKVYGPSRRAELRLITCGGGYSERTGYRGNVVVYAHLTGVRQS